MIPRLNTACALSAAIAAILATPGPVPALSTPAGVTSAAQGNRTVTPKDNGKTITISKTRKLTISLQENPSTAFQWVYKRRPNKKILRLVSDKTTPPNPPAPGEQIPTPTGVPVPRTIVYKAQKAGTTKIRLELVPPWSGKRAGILAITVKVR